jgi:hypothetical protein
MVDWNVIKGGHDLFFKRVPGKKTRVAMMKNAMRGRGVRNCYRKVPR